jgi:hypothetical protein
MNTHSSTVEQNGLARNLQQLAAEHEGRLRRISIRDRHNDQGWFTPWFRQRPTPGGVRLWWAAPASWAVVFFVGFLVTDWNWDAFGQFIGRLGL